MIRVPASGYPLPYAVATALAQKLGLPEIAEGDVEGKNPIWNRDELIVALDAYVRWNGNPPAKTSTDILGILLPYRSEREGHVWTAPRRQGFG